MTDSAMRKFLGHLVPLSGFRRDLAMTVGLQGLSLVLMTGYVLLLSRWLGAEGKGLQSLLLTVGQLASVVLGLGVSASIVSILGPDHRRASAVIRNQAWVLAFAATVLSLLVLGHLRSPFFRAIVGYEIGVALLSVALLGQISFASVLLALGQTWHFNIVSLLSAGVSLGMLAVAKYFNVLDVSVSITAQTTGALCGLLYSLVALKGAASNSEYYGVPVRFRDQGRIAVLAYFSGVLALILFRGDLFLLSSLCSQLNQVGVYSVAVFAVEVALKIPQWAASILTASVAADSRLAVSRTLRLFWHSVGISFLLFVCFLVIKKPFESVLNDILGPSFDGVWIVMLAVFPRVVFQAGGSILAANLAGRGYTLWHPGATLGGMLAVLALDVALVPRLGALGAGLASSVGYLAALVLVFVGFLKTNNIDTRDFLNDSVAMLRRH